MDQLDVAKVTLRELYPHATEEELAEADAFFEWYAEFALRVYERICQDVTAYAEFKALTAALGAVRLEESPSQPIAEPS